MKELKLTIWAGDVSRIVSALEDVVRGISYGERGDFSSDSDGFRLEYEIKDIPEPKEQK